MRRLVCLNLAALFLTFLLVVSGCATAESNGRHGLLDSDRSSPRQYTGRALYRPIVSTTLPGGSGGGKKMQLRRPAVEIAAGSLRWPLQQIKITSPFGQRGREFHEGIDLKAQQGTPVLAAQEGTVIYAGSKIRGYGNLIVIRHLRQFSTIYAHNSRLLVRAGQYVRQGQNIAISGRTGHVTGPHLHFEVRDGLAALNPLDYLPSVQAANTPPPAVKPPKRLVSARSQRVAADSDTHRASSFEGDTD